MQHSYLNPRKPPTAATAHHTHAYAIHLQVIIRHNEVVGPATCPVSPHRISPSQLFSHLPYPQGRRQTVNTPTYHQQIGCFVESGIVGCRLDARSTRTS